MKLAVFRDSCTPHAAEVVTGANARVLQSLVNKALLIRDSRDRYDIHELLRRYATERLTSAAEDYSAHQAHMTYYAEFTAVREADIKGMRQVEALDEVEADFENVRAAWEWAVEQSDYEALMGMIETLIAFGRIRSRQLEIEHLLQLARGKIGSTETPESACLKGYLTVHQLPFEKPSDQLDEALESARQNHDMRLEAHVYRIRSTRCVADSRFADAIDLSSRAIALYQAAGDSFYLPEQIGRLGYCYSFLGDAGKSYETIKKGVSVGLQSGNQAEAIQGLNLLGILQFRNLGEAEQSFAQMKEAMNLAEQFGNQRLTAIIASNIGTHSVFSGDFAAARQFGQRAYAIAAQLDLPDPLGSALRVLALEAAIVDEDYPEAKHLAQKALSLIPNGRIGTREGAYLALAFAGCGLNDIPLIHSALSPVLVYAATTRDPFSLTSVLPVAAYLAYRDGRHEKAVEWIALAEKTPFNPPVVRMDKWPLLTRLSDNLKAILGEEDFVAAWERGRTLDLETIVQELVVESEEDDM